MLLQYSLRLMRNTFLEGNDDPNTITDTPKTIFYQEQAVRKVLVMLDEV